MPDLTWLIGLIGSLLALITAIVTSVIAVRRWLSPIRITLAIKIFDAAGGPDSIVATITNVTKEDQYLVRCVARSTYPIAFILRRHLRHPLMRPRLYPNIWYAARSYKLMGDSPIKLESFKPETLHHSVSRHDRPLYSFISPMIQVEAELSTGRIFRSGRLEIPERWKLAYRLKQRHQDTG